PSRTPPTARPSASATAPTTASTAACAASANAGSPCSKAAGASSSTSPPAPAKSATSPAPHSSSLISSTTTYPKLGEINSFSTVPGQRSGDRRDRSGNGSLRRSIGGGGWAVQWMGSAVAWASRAVMTWSVCPASRGQGAGVDPVLGGGTAGLVQVPGTGP